MEQQNSRRRWFEDLESFSRRVLTTVLFTDVVDSTGWLVELGDRAWTALLADHHGRFRSKLSKFGGREVDAAGDGFLAAFEVPTLAVAFACGFHREVEDLGLQVRTGVHTGECELADGRLRGVAVHLGARLADVALPGEVLVSETVRDVASGSGLTFMDRGMYLLRGVPDRRRVFAAGWRTGSEAPAHRSARTRAAVGVRHRRPQGRTLDPADA